MASPNTIFITGGGSGMGLTLALRYLGQGKNIAVFDLRFSDEVKAKLEQACPATQKLSFHTANVCDGEQLTEEVNQAVNAIGKPQLIIHCAGILLAGLVSEQSQQEFEKVVSINLFGTRNMVAACLPHLETDGHIAMISSMAGVTGNYTYSAYCASKFGVMGLAKVLRMELKPKGIKVSVICPPEVSTPMVTEEHKSINPITLELKLVAGVLTVDEAVNAIMAGIEAKKPIIVPGAKAKLIYFLNRYMPDFILNSVVDKVIKKGLAK
ncbi:SDR family NAD(P)-dependent oxidoreductase [Vibrio rumoiensis]|nr:SDR family NAD(P)-dependent oxidoreductase [Vibrio rumoiensis]